MQHPMCLEKFEVIDHRKMPCQSKLEWVRHDVGATAELPEFVGCFVALFGDIIRGDTNQKQACLELFQLPSSGIKYKREVDLEPQFLE